jgi:outer membrane protein OmpA-like peptidoglycan-associated protein
MSTDTAFAKRSQEENWLPILEVAMLEVFEIMLGCQLKPADQSQQKPKGGFTAIVGLAGALCGVVTVCCAAETARQIAKGMLGDAADSEAQVADALGEICNMVAGNFESGAATMKAASQAAFDRIANLLRQRDYRLRIEGHTDNAPIHTPQFPSNWELSTSRATEIVRLLIVRDGFAPDRLSAAGYAEYHPVGANLTAEGRGMNRRVDVVILGHVLMISPLAEAAAKKPARLQP